MKHENKLHLHGTIAMAIAAIMNRVDDDRMPEKSPVDNELVDES